MIKGAHWLVDDESACLPCFDVIVIVDVSSIVDDDVDIVDILQLMCTSSRPSLLAISLSAVSFLGGYGGAILHFSASSVQLWLHSPAHQRRVDFLRGSLRKGFASFGRSHACEPN
jgi:hypothetical protein